MELITEATLHQSDSDRYQEDVLNGITRVCSRLGLRGSRVGFIVAHSSLYNFAFRDSSLAAELCLYVLTACD